MADKTAPIGVFDSGVGGISVLRELVKLMPEENYIYLGDSANAPYGSRPMEEIRELTLHDAEFLLQQGVKALVVACNTATSAAVRIMRGMYPDLPIVGIEPAIKPATLSYPGGRIAVMATPMTLKQEKFHALFDRYRDAAEIIPIAGEGLVEFIERGELDSPALEELVRHILDSHLDQPADAIVLGCTHYPFIRDVIQRVAPSSEIFDGGFGTAREARRRIAEKGLLNDSGEDPYIDIQNSSGDVNKILLSYQLLDS